MSMYNSCVYIGGDFPWMTPDLDQPHAPRWGDQIDARSHAATWKGHMGHGAAEIHDAFMAVVLFGAYHIYIHITAYIHIYIYNYIEIYTYTWHTCKTVKTPKLWCFILVRPRNERLSGDHIMPTFAMLIHIYSSCLFFPIARCVYHVGQICAALARNWCLEALHQVPNPQRFVIILRWFAPAWGVSNTWEAVAVGEGTSGGTFLGGRIGGD